MAVRNASPNPAPRTKTYSAESGYVYQYQFSGQERQIEGEQYRFKTSHDRRSLMDVRVSLPNSSLLDWEQAQGRVLSPTERYAIAKMALFAAFDGAESPAAIPQPITVFPEEVRAILNTLDLCRWEILWML